MSDAQTGALENYSIVDLASFREVTKVPREIAGLYFYQLLDCLTDLAFDISADFRRRPQLYRNLGDSGLPKLLADFNAQYGTLANLPGPAERAEIYRISFVQLPQMPAPPRKRLLGSEQRRALQLLAGTPFGATEAAMFLHGFTRRVLASLIHFGLATVEREKAGGQLVGRVRITEAGRRAIEGY
jgi:hypothetical protein